MRGARIRYAHDGMHAGLLLERKITENVRTYLLFVVSLLKDLRCSHLVVIGVAPNELASSKCNLLENLVTYG